MHEYFGKDAVAPVGGRFPIAALERLRGIRLPDVEDRKPRISGQHDGAFRPNLFDAIATGKADIAADLMRAHLAVQGEALTDLLAMVPRAFLEPLAS